MDSDFVDEIASELIDDVDVLRCERCGSMGISPDGVCLSCSSSQSSRKRRPLKIERRVARLQEKNEKIAMYVGLVLIILGGPGIVSMSYLHDWLQIPAPDPTYDTYEAFGPVNTFVVMLGLIVTIFGIFFLVVSLMINKGTDRTQITEVTR